jgi:hypothetical protein
MASPKKIGRSTPTIKIVKYAITIVAVVLTSLGSFALSDERALAASGEPVGLSISEHVVEEFHEALTPMVAWLTRFDQSPLICPMEVSLVPEDK